MTNPELSFSTHMYGNEIDSLIIDITNNTGSSYTTIFTKHGDQGNQWNDELVDLAVIEMFSSELPAQRGIRLEI